MVSGPKDMKHQSTGCVVTIRTGVREDGRMSADKIGLIETVEIHRIREAI